MYTLDMPITYPPSFYRKITGALEKELRRVDPALPWRGQLVGLIKKVRRGEMEWVDTAFIRALQAARDALPENPVVRFILLRSITEIGESELEKRWDQGYRLQNEEIRARLGIGDEDFFRGEGPEELEALEEEINAESVRCTVAAFCSFGEVAWANLFEEDERAFYNHMEEGRCLIFGPNDV